MNRKIVFILLTICAVFFTTCQKSLPYLNPELTPVERATDLVSRMTLEEKISQMMHEAVAIPRLGIPEYNWWNEGLHGVGRAGIATVFPQAIGLAAMWDSATMFDVATVISDEFRAKHNDFVSKNQRGIYQGLTVWSPNINIFRDPRWGRGQETYGEDPFLTGSLGVAFVKGLQGQDKDYLKVVATPKHYAVHSGPEPERHRFDARIGERDFWETYVPAFEACVKDAGAWSVMGAYNRYMGEACCASDILLNKTLRDKWQFKGYVVSDCGAIDDIYRDHKIVGTPAEAAALAVKMGCDLNCGDTYKYLKEAVEKGYITEKEIDKSVIRLFEARIKLGMFDPADRVPFNSIPISVNDSKENRELSLIAARKSIVLLKNENNVLPLSKNITSIAVVGPNADNVDVLYGNYNGVSSDPVTPLEGIRQKLGPNGKVEYFPACGHVDESSVLNVVPNENLRSGVVKGLSAEYFANANLEGKPALERIDSVINFSWDAAGPGQSLGNKNFSARWKGKLIPEETGDFFLAITADDGLRLFFEGEKMLESWINQSPTTYKKIVKLEKGKEYDISIEYYQAAGGASIRFDWGKVEKNVIASTVAKASSSDVILFFGGLSPMLEGEEMPVQIPGFSGGDRTDISLPAVQEKLLKALKSTGKPVIFINLSGSAVAFAWADQNLPAILQAWYPGQEGGNAIADILFGDYNPAGRLPVTFYQSVKDLPPFEDYNMQGRTYKYFKGKPLYPFGYGLSYSTFAYSGLTLPAQIEAGKDLSFSVQCTNTGKMEGEEVVQVYLKHKNLSVPLPVHSLVGFQRISLKAGETKPIRFVIPARVLAIITNEFKRVIPEHPVELFVGGGQPGFVSGKDSMVSGEVKIKGPDVEIL